MIVIKKKVQQYEVQPYKCRALLFILYDLLKWSTLKIAQEFEASFTTIYYFLKKFNMSIRSKREALKGRYFSFEIREKMRKAHIGRCLGETNPNWRGNEARNMAIHLWVKDHKPKPIHCEKCGKKRKLELSNIKSHIYTRNPADYRWFCRMCHVEYDYDLKYNSK